MESGVGFGYLDEHSKRMVRRAILKAVAIPGYQVPFASRELPVPYGWGTGGIQVTAGLLVPGDVLKVIDQGNDDTTNAVSIRNLFEASSGIATTRDAREATIIQTRHRIPDTALTSGQILVYQVPIAEPLRFLEAREAKTRLMHAFREYGLMHLKLYESIAKYGSITQSYNYPVVVNDWYLTDPTPIPKFDNPKMNMMAALQIFGAGREGRIYAIPPHTTVRSLDLEDFPFRADKEDGSCELCGSKDAFLDGVVVDDNGTRLFTCSDSDSCERRQGERIEGSG